MNQKTDALPSTGYQAASPIQRKFALKQLFTAKTVTMGCALLLGFCVLAPLMIVITSYSIHYTKLYEMS